MDGCYIFGVLGVSFRYEDEGFDVATRAEYLVEQQPKVTKFILAYAYENDTVIA